MCGVLSLSYEAWLRGRNVDALKKMFVATEIIIFDIELSMGGPRAYQQDTEEQ